MTNPPHPPDPIARTPEQATDRIIKLLDRVQPYLRHIPDVTHTEIEELRADLPAMAQRAQLADAAIIGKSAAEHRLAAVLAERDKLAAQVEGLEFKNKNQIELVLQARKERDDSAQKIAYLLGQIAAMDGMHEKRLTQFEQSRLRELRAELEALEPK